MGTKNLLAICFLLSIGSGEKKGADFIVANDVSHDSGVGPKGVMGGDRNRVKIVSKAGIEEWPEMTKDQVAERLAALIADRLKTISV